MKITYKFANEAVEIDVDEKWANIVIYLDRQEYNNDHKETRRHYSLDACTYEGEDFAVNDTGLERLFADESDDERLVKAIAKLKPVQQKLIRAIYFEGISVSDYAQQEGVEQSAISHRIQTAKNNLRKFI